LLEKISKSVNNNNDLVQKFLQRKDPVYHPPKTIHLSIDSLLVSSRFELSLIYLIFLSLSPTNVPYHWGSY